jgi:hypothetical protein
LHFSSSCWLSVVKISSKVFSLLPTLWVLMALSHDLKTWIELAPTDLTLL